MSLKELRKNKEEISASKTWRRLLINKQSLRRDRLQELNKENILPQVGVSEQVLIIQREPTLIFDRSNFDVQQIEEVRKELRTFIP